MKARLPIPVKRSWLPWWGILYGIGLLSTVTHGSITNDEAWFLQVLQRMTHGEVLYRQIFFGIPPFSAYLLYLPVRLFGAQILTIKAFQAAIFASSGFLVFWIAHRLKLNPAYNSLVGLAMLALSSPWLTGAAAPYTPLAILFMLCTLAAGLCWFHRKVARLPSSSGLVIAGVCAGLSFATKQTTGAFAILALASWIVLAGIATHSEGKELLKELTLVGAATFVSVVLFVVLPVVLSQSTDHFLDYAFFNKKTYLAAARIPYWNDVQTAFRSMMFSPSIESFRWLVWQSSLLMPPITLLIWVYGMFRSKPEQRLTGILLAIFSLSAFIDIFPRVTAHHASGFLPLMLLSSAWGWQASGLSLGIHPLRIKRTIYGVLASITLFTCLIPALSMMRPGYQLSRLPHFKGIIVQSRFNDLLPAAQNLYHEINGKRLFFFTPSASLLYLISKIPNPTPYDYPLVTAFGLRGEEITIDAIESGKIAYVCYGQLGSNYPLRPRRLAEYVETRMQFSTHLGICDLYTPQDNNLPIIEAGSP